MRPVPIFEIIDVIGSPARNSLSNTGSRRPSGKAWDVGEGLYARDGGRKYVNTAELGRILAAARGCEPEACLFAQLLAYTGARISELLALTPGSFQLETGIVTIVTLKRRKYCLRELPIPPRLMQAFNRHFDLASAQQSIQRSNLRLWSWSRTTAWRLIKRVMNLAGVVGKQACPRGLRHGFGVGTLKSGTALPIIQRWMGHARLSSTSIYTNVCGPDEIAFAQRFWESMPR